MTIVSQPTPGVRTAGTRADHISIGLTAVVPDRPAARPYAERRRGLPIGWGTASASTRSSFQCWSGTRSDSGTAVTLGCADGGSERGERVAVAIPPVRAVRPAPRSAVPDPAALR